MRLGAKTEIVSDVPPTALDPLAASSTSALIEDAGGARPGLRGQSRREASPQRGPAHAAPAPDADATRLRGGPLAVKRYQQKGERDQQEWEIASSAVARCLPAKLKAARSGRPMMGAPCRHGLLFLPVNSGRPGLAFYVAEQRCVANLPSLRPAWRSIPAEQRADRPLACQSGGGVWHRSSRSPLRRDRRSRGLQSPCGSGHRSQLVIGRRAVARLGLRTGSSPDGRCFVTKPSVQAASTSSSSWSVTLHPELNPEQEAMARDAGCPRYPCSGRAGKDPGARPSDGRQDCCPDRDQGDKPPGTNSIPSLFGFKKPSQRQNFNYRERYIGKYTLARDKP
jgi:hypothetical protein